MRNTKKYIVFKDGTAKIFPLLSIHAFMTDGKEVESAGFVELKDEIPVECYGESTTIGIKSRPEDIDILLANLKEL